jgi:hypothetical protein
MTKDDFDPDARKTPHQIFWRDWGFTVMVGVLMVFGVLAYFLFGVFMALTNSLWKFLYALSVSTPSPVLAVVFAALGFVIYVGARLLIVKIIALFGIEKDDAAMIVDPYAANNPLFPGHDSTPDRDASGAPKKNPWLEDKLSRRPDRSFFEDRPAPGKDLDS